MDTFQATPLQFTYAQSWAWKEQENPTKTWWSLAITNILNHCRVVQTASYFLYNHDLNYIPTSQQWDSKLKNNFFIWRWIACIFHQFQCHQLGDLGGWKTKGCSRLPSCSLPEQRDFLLCCFLFQLVMANLCLQKYGERNLMIQYLQNGWISIIWHFNYQKSWRRNIFHHGWLTSY